MGPVDYTHLAAALDADLDAFVGECCALYRTSAIRIPGVSDGSGAKPLLSPIVENLRGALPARGASPQRDILPGSRQVRELEQTVAFTGSVVEGHAGSAFDVAALILAVRDAAMKHVSPDDQVVFRGLFEWLVIVALESYGTAARMSEREREREQLLRGTPLVMITPELPAVQLIGAPDAGVLDSVFARLVLAVVRSGAPCVIVDVTGLADRRQSTAVEAGARFLAHRKTQAVEMVLVGLDADDELDWRSGLRADTRLRIEFAFDRAVVYALERSGIRLVGR